MSYEAGSRLHHGRGDRALLTTQSVTPQLHRERAVPLQGGPDRGKYKYALSPLRRLSINHFHSSSSLGRFFVMVIIIAFATTAVTISTTTIAIAISAATAIAIVISTAIAIAISIATAIAISIATTIAIFATTAAVIASTAIAIVTSTATTIAIAKRVDWQSLRGKRRMLLGQPVALLGYDSH
ncbi:hypothetical protein EDB87DRAFT_1831556 [Lactarius vividus]|nr:hypothetical protein EDB87DRAFT_1831556 [Lactarius vividus]